MAPTRRKPRIGIALGSGGARGWSHIGVLDALAASGIRPDIVCGTSIGALVGGAYAAGELERLSHWVRSLDWPDVLKLVDVTWRGGLIKGEKLFDFFRASFTDRRIDELPLPFGAVATELGSGREVWLRDGMLLDAVRASISMPGIFAPVARDGQVLVDGGLVDPVPVSMCRALGAQVVIAVDLGAAKLGRFRQRRGSRPAKDVPVDWMKRFGPAWLERMLSPREGDDGNEVPSIVEVFLTSIDIVQVRVARSRLAGDPADVLITPMLPDFVTMDFHRATEAIAEGREAVQRVRSQLEQLMEE